MPMMMTVAQTAYVLNSPESTVRKMCERKEIVAKKVGRSWRINKDALLRQYGLSSCCEDMENL